MLIIEHFGASSQLDCSTQEFISGVLVSLGGSCLANIATTNDSQFSLKLVQRSRLSLIEIENEYQKVVI